MYNVPEEFGSMVFNDRVMRARLPKEIYKAFHKTVDSGRPLDISVANVIANAMKEWAIEKGATHFTHWFQPMTGSTAEKHDSFIEPHGPDGVIMEFSGKTLVRGEPDASSFPSGGLRATFEARGYTAWDTSSYAFVKDGSLYIPTAFCSYTGEALDKKTPLLRSMQALNKEASRILKLFGKTDFKKVLTTVGAEQEYFLVDSSVHKKRMDLINCGRTLFGARPPKGQELEDHYFGAIRPRVAAYMKELDEELWKLGVYNKTKHNEVAPAQHELAPVFTTTNLANDQNQLTMEMMKQIASRHGLTCMLHEKPFAAVNGSGKHNNWSMCTDKGENLLEPGDTPDQNAQFILFLTAVIKAVDEYQDLLRVSVASASNDHRLGANEAPPAIVSMFLGDELTAILDAIIEGTTYKGKKKTNLALGVDVLPSFPKDSTDRNRTSPFAFTGNKFEFRMLGSTFSVAGPNVVLNTAVAEALSQFADVLEKAKDFQSALNKLVKETLKKHKRIIFNGNNYSEEWTAEAKKRKLLNLKTTVDAAPAFIDPKNVELFGKHGVLSPSELHSRYEMMLESYCKTLRIEAMTMVDMVKKEIFPSVITYETELANLAATKKGLSPDLPRTEEALLKKLSLLASSLTDNLEKLEHDLVAVGDLEDEWKIAEFYRDVIYSDMAALRGVADELETNVAKKYWAFPTYVDLLYSVK